MNILEIKNVKTSYNNHVAIENISFNIKQGEYVCLVGENGSGKSTLIKTILSLLKNDSGKINLKISFDDISYLSQNNLKDLDFPATAKEIILTGTQKHKKKPFYTKKDYENLYEICNKLKISQIINKSIGNLSGGQKQRIMLARALIRNPKMLILDEPDSGLDINITKELYKILDIINKENNVTILMATHDIDELKTINPRVICIAKTIVYDGNIEGWQGI